MFSDTRSFLVLALASVLPAQVQTTAHVQASTLGTFGNVPALGCSPTGLFAESRSQILIPAHHLPGPGAVLLGLEALGASSSATNTTLTYASLRITVSPTTAQSLQAAFAANLSSPQVVLDVQNLTVNWQAAAFTPITFAINYVHDGASALVLDIQKVVSPIGDASMKTIQNARRTDLPRMVQAFGGAGSGANLATTATVTTNPPLSLALRWGVAGGGHVPTLRLKSDPTAPFRAPFEIGQSFARLVQGEPGSLLLNVGSTLRLEPPAAFPGILGALWVGNPLVLDSGVMPASGLVSGSLSLPNDPSWVGLYLVFQSLVIEADGDWRLTNAADCFVTNGV